MADTLSNNFCSLCGRSFDRTGTDNTNIRTSLASPVVEESGKFLLKIFIGLCSPVDLCVCVLERILLPISLSVVMNLYPRHILLWCTLYMVFCECVLSDFMVIFTIC